MFLEERVIWIWWMVLMVFFILIFLGFIGIVILYKNKFYLGSEWNYDYEIYLVFV